MRGWLVVNSFISSLKSRTLHRFFVESAERIGIELEVKRSDTLICCSNDMFSEYSLPDFIIFWDKDVYLAERLERTGVPVFNSAKAINLCDNKIYTTLALDGKVPMPKTVITPKTFESVGYSNFDFLEKATKILGFPLIIKEAYGSFGQQVYLANDENEAKEIIKKIGYKDCLLQEFISESSGRDIRINVVGDEIVASMLRYNDNDYRSNISNGGKMQPYHPSEYQKSIALRACKILGLDFAGVDILFCDDGKSYICEVNSNPHFISTFDCTGINVSEKILRYIKGKIGNERVADLR